MALKVAVDTIDDLPEDIKEHYVEQTDDKGKKTYVLGLEGDVKPLPQFKTLRDENARYRIAARDFETKYGTLKAFEGMNATEVLAKLDRIAELEAAGGGKLDDAAIDKIVEGRMRTKLSPLERELATTKTERDTFKTQVDEMSTRQKQRLVADEVRTAAVKLKMLPEAVEDAILLAERNFEVTDDGVFSKNGDTPENWIKDLQPKRPHWWGPSLGGGARGGAGGGNLGAGKNPWSAENWNMTEQNKIFNTDPKRANALAERAGTKVGGLKPKPAK